METRQVGTCNYNNNKVNEYYKYHVSDPLATGNADKSIENLLSGSSKKK